jgi:hypothetical protein
MTIQVRNDEQVLYARRDVRACRGVKEYADIKKVKRRLKRARNFPTGSDAPRGWIGLWRALWSETGQMKIGTI